MGSYQTFKTEILVRDKMVQMMESKGIIVACEKLDKDEYIAALRKKVVEEANEAAEELLKNSAFISSANNLIHSKKGADIAVNGIATAIAAYTIASRQC